MLKWILFYLSWPWIAAAAVSIEANPLAFWMPLLNIGGVGAVLAFVLWKLEPRMKAAEVGVDRQTRMLAIFLIEMPHIMQAAKEQAESIVKELDRAKKLRNDPNET